MKKEFWIKKDRTKDGPDNWEKMEEKVTVNATQITQ